MVIWGAISTWLANNGVYLSDAFLAAYPTFWLPFIPVVLILSVLIISVPARTAVQSLIDTTPLKWLIGIHVLRILAVGTLIKAYKGEFSMSFATWVGIPDMLFGLSALFMLWLATKDRINNFGFMLWNMLGVLVIIPGAPIVAQMGLPGVFFNITETPTMVTLYEFPMVLAPSLVVPIFVTLNMLVGIRLIEKLFKGA